MNDDSTKGMPLAQPADRTILNQSIFDKIRKLIGNSENIFYAYLRPIANHPIGSDKRQIAGTAGGAQNKWKR